MNIIIIIIIMIIIVAIIMPEDVVVRLVVVHAREGAGPLPDREVPRARDQGGHGQVVPVALVAVQSHPLQPVQEVLGAAAGPLLGLALGGVHEVLRHALDAGAHPPLAGRLRLI